MMKTQNCRFEMRQKLDTTHIYQAFFFDNRVKAHFYPGDAFLGYREDMRPAALIALGMEIMEEDQFMPGLTRKLESLLGEGNFVSDFWEFGPDCFSLYWWICREVYHEKLSLIRQWAAYEEIDQCMEISEEVEK